MAVKHKSVETKWYEDRDSLIHGLSRLNRRDFFKVAEAAGAALLTAGLTPPHSFQLVEVAQAAENPSTAKFSFAYISDTHLYSAKLNDQFIRSAIRADSARCQSSGEDDGGRA